MVARLVACGLLLMGLAWAGATVTLACPFCSAPTLTLSERYHGDLVVIARCTGDAEDGESPEYEIVEVIRQPEKLFDKGQVVEIPFSNPKGQLVLLSGGTLKGKVSWADPAELTDAALKYVKAAPAAKSPGRLKWFSKYLENADQVISNDAFGEFAKASYEDTVPVAKELGAERVRGWLKSAKTPQNRLGMYGLFLGLCGDETDVPYLYERIAPNTDGIRLGIDGMTAGYLLLAKEPGLAKLEDLKFRDQSLSVDNVYPAYSAVQFLCGYAKDVIPRTRLIQSLHLLAKQEGWFSMVLPDLSRLKDWESLEEFASKYGQEGYTDIDTRSKILHFLISALKDVSPEDPRPAHANLAEKLLLELRSRDRKFVESRLRYNLEHLPPSLRTAEKPPAQPATD